jgi:glucose/arabinose dehydrogenase
MRKRLLALIVVLAQTAQLLPVAVAPVRADVHIPGFQLQTVWSGLNNPSALAFAPNGRVFVAERSGLIKTFTNVNDTSSEVAADLRTEVHSVADRGLLGLVVDPGFPTNPYIYVSYIRDAPPGGNPPFYGDACPNAPTTGAKDGCPATGRISRITVDGQGHMVGSPLVLIGGTFYCHQHQAHAVDHLAFGPDGALYASAGDGASSTFTDWG